MKSSIKILLAILLSSSLCACSGFFDTDNTPAPYPLVKFKPEIQVKNLWYVDTGFGVGDNYLKLPPAVTATTIYSADKAGYVSAFDKSTGKRLWQTNTALPITGGPAADKDNSLVIVCSRYGDVLALRATDGNTLWHVKTSSEVLAQPAIQGKYAIVKSIDGQLAAFSTVDGHTLWTYHQTEPGLILRGSSAPQISADSVIAGFASGNLSKLTLQGGNLIWQQTIAVPQGSFAIQRMVDIDANPLIANKRIYTATYQGNIAALDLTAGNTLWSHDISSFTGMTADANKIYISDAKSYIWAFDKETGGVDWRQTQLEARNVTAPVQVGDYIVVGDKQGYLHWMSKQDGRFVARTKVQYLGILANPVVDNGILYLVTTDGHVAAYTIDRA